MQAIVSSKYGSPDQLELIETDKPAPDADSVLVRVHAASVNPYDWHEMRGDPYFGRLMGLGLRKPKRTGRGLDTAGQVEAVGENVTELRPGDEVFGTAPGSFAEYVCGPELKFASKPARLSYAEAAAIPVAGVTALLALRDRGELQAGQKVLINGAAGGVGTFAVQIAKALGAEVTGVCSTRNLELVRSIGADHVVDYTVDDFTRSGQQYDLILDTVGNRSFRDLRRATTAKGTIVVAGGGGGKLFGPITQIVRGLVLSPLVSQSVRVVMGNVGRDDLVFLKGLVDDGKVTPVIDRTYPLSEAAEAVRYLEGRHAQGKVVITV